MELNPAHRGAVPPDPTRQAAQRLLALADLPTEAPFSLGTRLRLRSDVRLVAEAVMARLGTENAETCAIHDMDQHTRALVRERLRYHAAHGAMCDMRDERDALRAALILCAEIAGTDGESIEAGRSGALRHPEVSELAVEAVRQLRSDYDEDVEDLRGHGLAHVAANDGLARDVVALQAEVVRLREALEELNAWVSRMPDAGFTDADPRWRWWHEQPRAARAALKEDA